SQLGERLVNDLEPVVEQRYTEIPAIKERLLAEGAKGALLSGSGSTVFGIFDHLDQAKRAYAEIGKTTGGELFLTETITNFSDFLPEGITKY
ncbi:MAG: hypothetical protein GWM98_19215, partial [Nitrospinaceae bacterium]|nr:hypothetical protein [Nitrospinaceae bacterium]NIR56223.1 hypothetical protein [Nitrospinaceae bacterium]NIS86679.1 hypothetical protein [Nitrospinaceae bacterium]NIT83512.1 hypothetical protein [Nitrospinaceae bacterium]NIU45717.1 hypothetical protein [Nitrospinaceae bacterium]